MCDARGPRASHAIELELTAAFRAFPIVAVGASAGGLEAFSQLLANLDTKLGMAYVLVQHLDPAHDSLLAEILGRSTTIPVVEAHDGNSGLEVAEHRHPGSDAIEKLAQIRRAYEEMVQVFTAAERVIERGYVKLG